MKNVPAACRKATPPVEEAKVKHGSSGSIHAVAAAN
jgi:hypothetical protein